MKKRNLWFWAWLLMLLGWACAQWQPYALAELHLVGPPLSAAAESTLFGWLSVIFAVPSVGLAILAAVREE